MQFIFGRDENGYRFFGIFNSMSQISAMNAGWMAVLNTGTHTYNQTNFEYAEYLQVKLGCDFGFNKYPFDRHDCDLKFFCPSYDEPMLQFKEIHLYDRRTGGQVPKNESLDLKNERIPFHAQIRNLLDTEPAKIVDYSFATAGIQFNLERTDLALLMSGYFVPTGMFAVFSLLSFLISIENVSRKTNTVEQ